MARKRKIERLANPRRPTLEEEVEAFMRESPHLDEAEVEAELIRLRREDP